MIQVHSSAAAWGKRNTIKQPLKVELLLSRAQMHDNDGGLSNDRDQGWASEGHTFLGPGNTTLPMVSENQGDGNLAGGSTPYFTKTAFSRRQPPEALMSRVGGGRPGPLASCETSQPTNKKPRKKKSTILQAPTFAGFMV